MLEHAPVINEAPAVEPQPSQEAARVEPTVEHDQRGGRVETTSTIDPETQALTTEKRRFLPDGRHDLCIKSTELADGSIDHAAEKYFLDGVLETRHQIFEPGSAAGDRPRESHSKLYDEDRVLSREQGYHIDPETGDECSYQRSYGDGRLIIGTEISRNPGTGESSRISTGESRTMGKAIRVEHYERPSNNKTVETVKIATEWSPSEGDYYPAVSKKVEVRECIDAQTGEPIKLWQNSINNNGELVVVEAGEERTDPATGKKTESVSRTPIEKQGYNGRPPYLEYPELSVDKIRSALWIPAGYQWSLNQEDL